MIHSNYDYEARKAVEEVILGAILIDGKNLYATKEILFKNGIDYKECFSWKFHQDLFERILLCWHHKLSADLITIQDFKQPEYEKDSRQFTIDSIALTQKISSTAHLEYHIAILKQYLIIDYWNNKANDILNNDWRTRDCLDVSENIVDGYNLLITKLTEQVKISDTKGEKEKLMEKWQKVQSGEYFTVLTEIEDFDNFTNGGFHPCEFTIIAGRPGMGKSSVTLMICQRASYNRGKKGLFFTLEMPRKQLQARVISEKLGIDRESIRTLKVDSTTMQKIVNEYEWMDNESNLKIIDNCRTLMKITKKIEEEKPDYVVIDYLQLIKLDGKIDTKVGNREQEISTISRTLKDLAVIHDIPVIALSQLSRSLESRLNKRPLLSDLRESGSLEQDADNVIFLYRDAYYAEKAGQQVPEYQKGNLEFILAKGRETGTKNDIRINVDFKANEIRNYFLDHNNYEDILKEIDSKKNAPKPPAPPPPK